MQWQIDNYKCELLPEGEFLLTDNGISYEFQSIGIKPHKLSSFILYGAKYYYEKEYLNKSLSIEKTLAECAKEGLLEIYWKYVENMTDCLEIDFKDAILYEEIWINGTFNYVPLVKEALMTIYNNDETKMLIDLLQQHLKNTISLAQAYIENPLVPEEKKEKSIMALDAFVEGKLEQGYSLWNEED
ncbi:MAG: hypothetical protein ACREPR_00540 [Brasilonema sp.]